MSGAEGELRRGGAASWHNVYTHCVALLVICRCGSVVACHSMLVMPLSCQNMHGCVRAAVLVPATSTTPPVDSTRLVKIHRAVQPSSLASDQSLASFACSSSYRRRGGGGSRIVLRVNSAMLHL
jgi:hypothetical protein